MLIIVNITQFTNNVENETSQNQFCKDDSCKYRHWFKLLLKS